MKKIIYGLLVLATVFLLIFFLTPRIKPLQEEAINETPCDYDKELRSGISEYNQKLNPNYSIFPQIDKYAVKTCQWISDIIEMNVENSTIRVFQSVPAGCGSCATRTVNYLWKDKVHEIVSGHEVKHEVVEDNGKQILKITYGLLEPGDTNSNYQWTMVQEYIWDNQTKNLTKIYEIKQPHNIN